MTAQGYQNAANSTSSEFSRAAKAKENRPKRQPPFSMRLSPQERERLLHDAAGMPLGAYVKARVFSDGTPIRARRAGLPVEDRKALSQALALLGQTRLSSNINQIAKAIHLGTINLNEDLEAELREACDHIKAIRETLILALGLLEGGGR